MNETVRIKRGSVLVYRVFDVAEEIDLTVAESLLQNSRGPDSFKVPKFIDRGLVLKSRPVTFGLGNIPLELECGTFQVNVITKIRDYGVLSLIYEIPIEDGTSWTDLLAIAADLEEGSEIDMVSKRQVKQVSERIAASLKKPTDWDAFEDYIIYFFQEFHDGVDAKSLLAKADVPALILAEDDAVIGAGTRERVLESVFQYAESDLAIIEWNSAVVVEPSGARELPDILEFAVTHLLEMRFYDDLLDRRLKILYDDIERSKGHRLRGRFNQLYQDASTRYIEFSEFIERVENSLKVVGDFYLAVVYRAALRRFRIADWQQNVTRKMNLLAQVSNLLQGEVNMRRSHWLEAIIIFLILFEIVSTFLKLV